MACCLMCHCDMQLPVAPEGLAMQAEVAKAKEEAEARRRYEEDEADLRSLRMALREITTKLLCTRQWKEFWEPVDPEEDPDYYTQVFSSRPSPACVFASHS